MGDDRPIGMFDSGFGGLTVARAVIDLLPGEDLVYVGDTGRYPYGPRPPRRGARLRPPDHSAPGRRGTTSSCVVVACNTAAAAALDELRPAFDVPVVGVIEPGVRALVQATRDGAGRRDRHGRHDRLGRLPARGRGDGRRVELTCAACPGFVEFVERGETHERPGARARRAAAGADASTRRSTRCCSAAPTTRTWPARSATSWAATSCSCRRPTRRRSRCGPSCTSSDLAAPLAPDAPRRTASLLR